MHRDDDLDVDQTDAHARLRLGRNWRLRGAAIQAARQRRGHTVGVHRADRTAVRFALALALGLGLGLGLPVFRVDCQGTKAQRH